MPSSTAMAAAQCATAVLLLSSPRIPRKSLPLISCVSTQSPRKLTKRKNYLRSKLLKTLRQPYPRPLFPDLPPTDHPTIPVESPLNPDLSFPTEQFSGNQLKESEVEEYSSANSQLTSVNANIGSVAKSFKGLIFKVGVLLLGAFFVHYICAVLVIYHADNEAEKAKLKGKDKSIVFELGGAGSKNSKTEALLNGNSHGELVIEKDGVLYVDENEMKKRIQQIQEMARKARENERLSSKDSGFDGGDEDDDEVEQKGVRTGIIKEVENRLVKLQTKLQKDGNKFAALPVDYLRGDSEETDAVDNGALMFKKKHKFRGLSNERNEKPKGFTGSFNGGVSKVEEDSRRDEVLMNGNFGHVNVEVSGDKRASDLQEADSTESVSSSLRKDGEGKRTDDVSETPRIVGRQFMKEGRGREASNRLHVVKSASEDGYSHEQRS